MLAQTVHAAGESASRYGQALPPHTRAVALGAADEAALEEAAARLSDRQIPHVVIREPDAPFFGARTAIGVVPTADRASVKKALGRLRLLG